MNTQFLIPSLALVAAAATSCAPSSKDNTERTTVVGTDEGEPDAATSGGGANGSDDPVEDLGAGGARGEDAGTFAPDAACAATAVEATSITVEETIRTGYSCGARVPGPLNLYILLDNSGSMGTTKWADAVTALTEFVSSPPSPDAEWACADQDGVSVPVPDDLEPVPPGAISVALQYFHPDDRGGGTEECDGSGHRVPAVPMRGLADNASALVASLNDPNNAPNGGTPTLGALIGGTEYCADFQFAHSGQQCMVVLVTDGEPAGCGLSGTGAATTDTLTSVAADAYTTGGVVTFTVGMDGVDADGFALLDAIAVAGHSDCTPPGPGQEACNVSTTGAAGLLAAFNTIRDSVQASDQNFEVITSEVTTTTTLPCEWEIPPVPEGQQFDRDRVNVDVTVRGSEKQELGRVDGEGDCTDAGGGWYYDDPSSPKRILACPGTCETLEALTDARVDVLLGCATRRKFIR